MDFIIDNFEILFNNEENIKKLESIILDLAVRGKLVSQNSSDEPASNLIKKIKKEKKIKKTRVLKEIKEEEIPFDIPKGWEWVRLGNVVDFQIGKTPSSKLIEYWNNGEYYWLNIGNMVEGGDILSTNKKITNKAVKDVFKAQRITPINTLLMSFKLTIGRVSINKVPLYHNEGIVSIYPDVFVKQSYLFKTLPVISSLSVSKKVLMGQTFNSKSLNDMLVPLPPLNEQKRIVERIEQLKELTEKLKEKTKNKEKIRLSLKNSIMSQIEKSNDNDELLNNLDLIFNNFDDLVKKKEDVKDIRNLILSMAVKGKLVKQDESDEPASVLLKKIKKEKDKLIKEKKIKKSKALEAIKGEEIPFDIPESWEWVRLGDIITLSTGKGLTSKEMVKTGDIPVYGGNGITGYHNKFNTNKNTVVMGRVGFYCGSIHLTIKTAWVTDNAFILIFNEKKVYKQFLIWLLRATNLKEQENATAQPVISGRKIYPILIPFPPLNEQKRIVEKVDKLMEYCDDLEEKVVKRDKDLQILMDSLI
jgi:type I restriction enzyme S subunit